MTSILCKRVRINIKGTQVVIGLSCLKEYTTVKWISRQLINKTWRIYGERISIDYLIINGSKVQSPEAKIQISKGHKQEIRVHVKAHQKGLDEYYENVCSRLKIPIVPRLKDALKDHTDNELNLSGLALSSEDVPVLRFLLARKGPLDNLDLSANLLDDDAIIKLLTDMRCPRHVDLRSNLLTGKCLKHIFKIGQGRLSSLRVSYNKIESTSKHVISDLSALCTSLEVLDLEEH
ncbi:hypothetical protein J3Q64DRAFT_1143599 [Phycomyces blakesleeanus]|uniref:Uncharacterized protein n=1 Tax=Phycomyces blakesleeanus TaxID=4837 RepID=A0ABR3AVZ8_PHYBL